jgi:hypothetical protein
MFALGEPRPDKKLQYNLACILCISPILIIGSVEKKTKTTVNYPANYSVNNKTAIIEKPLYDKSILCNKMIPSLLNCLFLNIL